MQDMQNMDGKSCGCGHHKMMPTLIVLFGLVFLLQALGVLTDGFVGIVWPILVLVAGFMKMGMCKCC